MGIVGIEFAIFTSRTSAPFFSRFAIHAALVDGAIDQVGTVPHRYRKARRTVQPDRFLFREIPDVAIRTVGSRIGNIVAASTVTGVGRARVAVVAVQVRRSRLTGTFPTTISQGTGIAVIAPGFVGHPLAVIALARFLVALTDTAGLVGAFHLGTADTNTGRTEVVFRTIQAVIAGSSVRFEIGNATDFRIAGIHRARVSVVAIKDFGHAFSGNTGSFVLVAKVVFVQAIPRHGYVLAFSFGAVIRRTFLVVITVNRHDTFATIQHTTIHRGAIVAIVAGLIHFGFDDTTST